MVTSEILEDRFKSNMLCVIDILSENLLDAVDAGVLPAVAQPTIQELSVGVRKHIQDRSGETLIEGFIKCSMSPGDLEEVNESYSKRKYPEYWSILADLPSVKEIEKEKALPAEKCIPLSSTAESFFLNRLHLLFPIVKPFQQFLNIPYKHVFSDGTPFLGVHDKKEMAAYFRACPILAIKYINMRRNPVVKDGKLVLNPTTGSIQYNKGSPYHANISIKNAMNLYEMSVEQLLL